MSTSLPSNPVTGSENTTSNTIGDDDVGSSWPAAWSTVTDGGSGWFQVTVLSIDVDASESMAAPLWAAPAGIVAITSPLVVIPLTNTVYDAPEPVTSAASVPPAVDAARSTPLASNPTTDSLKATSNRIGSVDVGSSCPAPSLIVTVGAGPIQVTVLSMDVEAGVGRPFSSSAAAAGIVATTSPLVVMPVTVTVYVVPDP